jgi:hypothetical protein
MLEDFSKRTKLLLKSFFFLLIYPLFKNALLFASKRQGVLGKTSRRFYKRPLGFARVNISILSKKKINLQYSYNITIATIPLTIIIT